MKFNTIEELKQFIIWAKREKVSSFSVGEVSFTISEMAHIPDYGPILGAEAPTPAGAQSSEEEPEPESQEYRPNSKTWTDSEIEPEDDDELLFWSATPN